MVENEINPCKYNTPDSPCNHSGESGIHKRPGPYLTRRVYHCNNEEEARKLCGHHKKHSIESQILEMA